MPGKKATESKAVIFDNKAAPHDCRESIDKMGPISLKRYMKDLEEKGLTTKECYAYAQDRLMIALAMKEEQRRRKKAENERKAAEKEKRRESLSEIGNDRIRTLVYDEYMSLYSAHLSRLKEKNRIKKVERLRNALLKIDFVGGKINSDWWGSADEIVYLTDKNVLVFNGIDHDAYIYLPCQNETKLNIISFESMRGLWFETYQEICLSSLRDIRREFWVPILEIFPADFMIRIFYRYYLNYVERPSEGRETTNIPCFEN